MGGSAEFGEPIDLPDGIEHGRAGALSRGCECETCITARRTYERAWLATRRTIPAGVPATRARHKLTQLDDACVPLKLIHYATRVPLGVLRQLHNGRTEVVAREHETALLAVTADICLSHANRTGSRGRVTARAEEHIDAAPTTAVLDQLARRGFSRLWVGRELGLRGSLQIRDRVTRHLAERVAELARRIGDHQMPPRPRNRALPTLAQLFEEDSAA